MVLHSVVANSEVWFPSMSCLELEALPHTRLQLDLNCRWQLQTQTQTQTQIKPCIALRCAGLQQRQPEMPSNSLLYMNVNVNVNVNVNAQRLGRRALQTHCKHCT
jgi:hypothetical protein